MALLYFLCAALLAATANAQCLPLASSIPNIVSPCQQLVSPIPSCQSPQVVTTVVDNSVSNALANALQLLIVSNLIENTMNTPCGCGLNTLPAITPICDSIPVQASMYAPTVDVIAPYVPFDPIPISPCDVIAPCEPVIDIIPNCYPEVVSIPNVGCGCGGCDSFIPNFGSNCGCGNANCNCGNFALSNILPNLFPNIGCGCKNFGYDVNPFGQMFGCDQCGGIPDIFPSAFPAQVSCSYGYGVPNMPVAVSVDPWGYDSCPNKCFGNNYYY